MISSLTFKSFQDAIKNMTHSFQNSLLLFNYDDVVEENRNNVVYNTLLSLNATLQEKESKGIFISLKKIFSHKLVGTTFVISSISWFSNL